MTNNDKTITNILKLKGEAFIKSLLLYEQTRFDAAFLKNSVYEEMNADYGIFPAKKIYPSYFFGNIFEPNDKFVFIGINPGYSEAGNEEEQKHTEKNGILNTSKTIFQYFKMKRKGLYPYYANIAGFLKRLYKIEKIDWDWYQNNFINLEMIPYHSSNANGIRINNLKKYKDQQFTILTKFLDYIQPKKPIFILGFNTFEQYLKKPEFNSVIKFNKHKNFWIGKITNKYNFIGLPFLTRINGGKDQLVKNIQELNII